jgi:hypothetical protein
MWDRAIYTYFFFHKTLNNSINKLKSKNNNIMLHGKSCINIMGMFA